MDGDESAQIDPDVGSVYGELLGESWQTAVSKLRSDGELGVDYYPQYTNDPLLFHKEVLGRKLWAASAYTIEALHKHRLVTVRAGRKVSKTHTAAGIVTEFMSTGPCIVVTISTTQLQIRRQLWAEIRKAKQFARKRLPGKIYLQNWDVGPDWYAIGFATNDPDNVLGYHAGVKPPDDPNDTFEFLSSMADSSGRRLLYVMDEAPGIDSIFYDSMFGSISGENVYALVQGNPVLATDDPHPFVKIHHPDSGWHRIHIGAEAPLQGEDPLGAEASFTDVPEWLVEKAWVVRMAKQWGTDSPAYLAFVKGLFAPAGSGRMHAVSETILQAALAVRGTTAQGRHIGVDVSRSPTGDEAVASLWADGVKRAQHSWRGLSYTDTADLIIQLMVQWGDPATKIPVASECVHVDATGAGTGVTDRLAQRGYFVDAIDFGGPALGDWIDLTGDMKFRNRRAELHWVYRRMLEEGYGHLPAKWTESWDQAKWPGYELRTERSTGTELIIEPKDDIRKRHGRSPDAFESDILAWSRATATPIVGVWN